jgi:uncharacterized membrane protein
MKNFGGVAVPLAVGLLVSLIPNFVLSFGRGFAVALLTQSSSIDPMLLMVVNFGSLAVTYLISLVAQAYVMGGIVNFAIRVARGETPDFGVVFAGGRYFGAMLGGTLLYTLGVSAATMFCLVPGFFLAGCWLIYSAFIVDKGMGPIAALSASWQATTPYRTNALVYVLLSFLVGLAGGLACLIGALLVSFPVLMIGNAYIYLKLTGEQPRLPA